MAEIAGLAPLEEDDPRALGPYRLLGRLGDGGMGSVYLARRQVTTEPTATADEGPLVAVKVIRPDLARIPEFRERFLREGQAARRVARFCTAEVLDISTDGPRPYLVTEYIDGPTLWTAVRDGGPMAVAGLERLAVAVASALSAIHAAGVVHRDLKPGNILLSPSGARVIDFGIARALESTTTITHGSIGTPGFMAPEQALGQPATTAADVYAWGAVVVFAATGRAPFGEGPTPVILRRVATQAPDLTGVPADLRPLVARAMAKNPADRPTADELLLLLHRVHSPAPGPTPAPPRLSAGAPPPPATGAADSANVTTRPLPPPEHAPPTGPPADRPPARRDPAHRWLTIALAAITAVSVAVAVSATVLAVTRDDRPGGTTATAGTTPRAAPSATATAAQSRRTTADALSHSAVRPIGHISTVAWDVPTDVFDVAFSPDGRTLASLESDPLSDQSGNSFDHKRIELWDVTDPARPAAVGEPFDASGSGALYFSPDGHTLAANKRDGTVQLWNVTNPAKPAPAGRTPAGPEGWSHGLAFSPDSHTLAIVLGDGTVRLWNVTDPASPTPLGEPLASSTDYVHSVAFVPGGHTLAIGGDDGSVRLWDVTDPVRPAPLGQPFDVAWAGTMEFTADGHILVTLGETIRFWNVEDLARPRPLGQPLFGVPSNGGMDMALSPDGTVLAFNDQLTSTIRFWDITNPATPTPLGQPVDNAGGWNLAFSPDGHTLASAGGGSLIQLWSVG
ncbi:protein kinase [Frankia sp. CNm7]|uniref:WD40 repeat domain-containing serine/threonine protein kinase n=1 Tax=Frankia nepalensis TaxID=1836974 RepID=UPI00193379F8|nr:serine/threonine-protein kinase [Frankia nepalensis]MBL7522243.1 protein kinase [Frankia nepalensis]